jgi:acid phosphatase
VSGRGEGKVDVFLKSIISDSRGRSIFATTLALATLCIALTGTGGAQASGTARAARDGVPAFHHVFVVVMENLDYATALETPGLDHLANSWALATSYYGASHPSLPNYLALTGGSTFGVTSDCVTCYVDAANLFSQLSSAHLSFDAYLEGVPGACYLAPWGGNDYASKHNPFRYYDDVRASPRLCSHLRPYGELAPLLRGSSASVPDYVWVTPNLCDDGHDCPPSTAAAWLSKFVSEVTASAAWKDHGVLFVTWDESDGDDSAVVAPGRIAASGGGGHVMTLVIAPGLRRGLRVGVAYNHYSLLATVEDAFGLTLLQKAQDTTAMSAFFKTGPSS